MRFSTKIYLSIFASTLLLGLVLAATTYFQSKTILEKRISSHMQDMASQTLEKISQFMYERRFDLILLSNNHRIRSPESTREELKEELDTFRENHFGYASLSIFDLNRIRLVDTENLNLGKQDPLHPHWEDILSGNISPATSIEMSSSLKIPTFYFAAPVRNQDGIVFRAVVARITIHNLNGILQELGGEFFNILKMDLDLLDQTGKILYSNYGEKNQSERIFTKHPMLGQIDLEKGKGTFFANHPDSVIKDIVVYAVQEPFHGYLGNKWIVLLHFPVKLAFRPVTQLFEKLMKFLVVFILLNLLLSLFLSRSFASPLKKLNDTIHDYGKGRRFDSKLLEQSKDEIGALAKTFEEMTQNRQYLEEKIGQAQEKVIESRKMSSIGEMAKGLCHEILNPLNIISLKIQVYLKTMDPDAETADLFETIKHQCERIQETIRGLLAFAEAGKTEVPEIQVNEILQKSVQLVRQELNFQNINIVMNLAPSLPLLSLNPVEFEQCMFQLLTNGKEAMPKGGVLTIESCLLGKRDNEADIQITIQDTGVGVPQEIMGQIMDPFFSTKPEMYGTGMGLAIVNKIVKTYGGQIEIQSKINSGTRVRITLPAKSAYSTHDNKINS